MRSCTLAALAMMAAAPLAARRSRDYVGRFVERVPPMRAIRAKCARSALRAGGRSPEHALVWKRPDDERTEARRCADRHPGPSDAYCACRCRGPQALVMLAEMQRSPAGHRASANIGSDRTTSGEGSHSGRVRQRFDVGGDGETCTRPNPRDAAKQGRPCPTMPRSPPSCSGSPRRTSPLAAKTGHAIPSN